MRSKIEICTLEIIKSGFGREGLLILLELVLQIALVPGGDDLVADETD